MAVNCAGWLDWQPLRPQSDVLNVGSTFIYIFRRVYYKYRDVHRHTLFDSYTYVMGYVIMSTRAYVRMYMDVLAVCNTCTIYTNSVCVDEPLLVGPTARDEYDV